MARARDEPRVQTAAQRRRAGIHRHRGSLALVAPLIGVDTLAVYSEERSSCRNLLRHAGSYRQAGAARFDTLDLRSVTELDLLARLPPWRRGFVTDRRSRTLCSVSRRSSRS